MNLSIIVPIYNVAPYLRKCVDSLLAQDISDYEIILVDDGSTDDSGAIADEIFNAFSLSPLASRLKMRVIHQWNAGLSAARNSGIKVAQGNYILFVDSDDYLQPNTLGTLLEQAERDNIDVLRFRYQNVKENGEVFNPYKNNVFYNDYSATPTDGLTFLNERMGTQCYAWQFITKRDIVRKELFTPGIYFEDTDWTPRMLLRASRVASTELVVYNYLWREGSITLSKNIDKIRKQLEDKITLVSKLKKIKDKLTDTRWFEGILSGLVINIVALIADAFYLERKKYIEQVKQLNVLPLKSINVAPRAIKKIKLINLSINIAIFLLHMKNKLCTSIGK